MSQLKLKFDCEIKVKEKRVRFKPDWDKFYTVYMFDKTKYHRYMEAVVNKDESKLSAEERELLKNYTVFQREEIKELCYVRDENRNKKLLGDERHIYRIKDLYDICLKLYEYAHLNPLLAKEEVVNRLKYQSDLTLAERAFLCRLQELKQKGYSIYFDYYYKKGKLVLDNMLEIKGTELLPITERVKAHIDLLRRLKKGERL